MSQNSILKVLIKPVNFSSRFCHKKIETKATFTKTAKIHFINCPFCKEENSYCSYFETPLTKTKYEAHYRTEKCVHKFYETAYDEEEPINLPFL